MDNTVSKPAGSRKKYPPGCGPAATFWVFAILCAPALYVTIRLIPETKGKSLEQIEDYWKSKLASNKYFLKTSPTL